MSNSAAQVSSGNEFVEPMKSVSKVGSKLADVELGMMKNSSGDADINELTPSQGASKRLFYIDWIRAMAILSVVFVHVMEQLETNENTPQWMIDRRDGFIKVFCTFGVPIFFYTSGYAQALNRRSFWTYSKKRLIRMLLPTILAIPILLQPMQYFACNRGHIRRWCKDYFPEYPVSYLKFLTTWYSSGLSVLTELQWLWFLPAMLAVDLLNYAPGRFMLYLLEGGFYEKNGRRRPVEERTDVVAACFFNLSYFVLTGYFCPMVIPYHIVLLLAQLSVCVGLVIFIKSKEYPVWFITCWILPTLTALIALFWPHMDHETAGTLFLTFNLFTIFSLQGQLEQMVSPYWHKFEREGGKNWGFYKVVRSLRFIWALFWLSLSIPSSGHGAKISQVPMYRESPGLAFLAQIATWMALKLVCAISNKYYNEPIDEGLFLHITQSPIIIYLFHMPLVVLSFSINDYFLPNGNMVYMFLVDAGFVFFGSFSIYYMFLQSKATRAFFGLKTEFRNGAPAGYQRISQITIKT